MKISFVIFFMCVWVFTNAQEGLQFELPKPDSAQLELERKLMYRQLLSGELSGELSLEPLKLPDFDFKKELLKRYNFSVGEINTSNFSPLGLNYSFSPIFRNGAVFSAASYQLGEKFVFGGYSFGANSIFSAPFPNQQMNQFDTRGSTLYLQYKVSKNFKIETRVNVTQGAGPGF